MHAFRFLPAAVLLQGTLVAVLATSLSARQRDLKEVPEPNPTQELAAMKVASEIDVNLFASDPMMSKPIAMNFGPDGKLWIASSSAYPQLAPGEVANDQVIVVVDTDHDGIADRQSIFADKLLIPTGLLPDLTGNGVYVAASTQLLHFEDVDGDGKSDKKRLILSGFGTEDTHHMLHTLRWGPDGWLYMNQSIYIHSHVETPYGTQHLDGGGIWRFHPPTGRLEVVCKGFVNPWGHVFDASGMQFATDGAYGEGVNYVFDGSVFVTSPGAERWLSGLNPGSPKHCGLEVLSGRHVPSEWQGNMITNDFRAHGVSRFALSQGEQGYVSRQQPDLIRSSHVAFRPIDCKMGPDGALYVADWYNPIIQHGEVDFRDPRRDRTHGRIWRVTWKDRPLESDRFRPEASIEELVSRLEHPQESLRQWSRLELRKRDWNQVLKVVRAWSEVDDKAEPSLAEDWCRSGLNRRENRLLEHLRVTLVCGKWDEELVNRLARHANPLVRAMTLNMANRESEQWKGQREILDQAVLDPHWQVRLAALIGLREIATVEALHRALSVVGKPMDNNLDFVLWSFVRELEPTWSPLLAKGDLPWMKDWPAMAFVGRASRSGDVANWLATQAPEYWGQEGWRQPIFDVIVTKGDPTACGLLLKQLFSKVDDGSNQSLEKRRDSLYAMVEATTKRNLVPHEAASLLQTHFPARSEADKVLEPAVALAAARWKVSPLASQVVAYIQALPRASKASKDAEKLVESLGELERGMVVPFLEKVLEDAEWPETGQAAAYRALGRVAPPVAARRFVERLKGPADQTKFLVPVIVEFASKPPGNDALVAALSSLPQMDREIAKMLIDRSRGQWKGELPSIVHRLGGLRQNRREWSVAFRDEILGLVANANPVKGEGLFRQASLQCLKCHPIGSASGQIGPNLISLGGSAQPDYILESLIVPEARQKEGFETLQVLLDDGTSVSGLLRSRADGKLNLLTAEGKVVSLDNQSIESEKTGGSLMPAGLTDNLSNQELADLVCFLSQLGRNPEYTVREDSRVRQMEFLLDNHTKQWSPDSVRALAKDGKQGTWTSAISRLDGSWPIAEVPMLGGVWHDSQNHSIAISRLTIDCQQAGTFHFLGKGAKLLYLVLDGQPIDVASEVALRTGLHQLHFVWNGDTSDRLELQGVSADGGSFRPAEK